MQRYAPQLEKETRWHQGYSDPGLAGRRDLIRVEGEWEWLSRAIDREGRAIDFMLTDRRNGKAVRRFLAKALKLRRHWPPFSITSDKNPAYGEAIRELKRRDQLPPELEHRQVKYLNDRLEADHGPIKRPCRATLGFKSMKTAYATIKGFEAMRMIRKRQCICLELGVTGEVRFVAKLFGSMPESRSRGGRLYSSQPTATEPARRPWRV